MQVIGVGNDLRGDDAAGLVVARAVRQRVRDGVEVHESHGDGTTLIGLWSGAGRVVVVDAMRCGATPGTVVRFDALEDGRWCLPASAMPPSSHAFGVLRAVALGRTLGLLPSSLVVYGIEGKRFGIGQALSPAVARVVPSVVEQIIDEVTG